MNLKGFCAGDPSQCNTLVIPQQFNPNIAQAAAPQLGTPLSDAILANPYAQKTAAFLYRLAAYLGCKGVCPALPTLGKVAIGLLGIPESISVGGTAGPVAGAVVEVASVEVGRIVGEFIQSEICASCQ